MIICWSNNGRASSANGTKHRMRADAAETSRRRCLHRAPGDGRSHASTRSGPVRRGHQALGGVVAGIPEVVDLQKARRPGTAS